MSDDLVKRWDDHVESLCSPMSTIEHMAQKMRNRIEALTTERERLRGALEETAQILSQCTFKTIRVHGQYIDRREAVSRARAALKGETP